MIIAWLIMGALTVLSVLYVMHYLVRHTSSAEKDLTDDFLSIRQQEVTEERKAGRLTAEESKQLLNDVRSESETLDARQHRALNHDTRLARIALSAMIAVLIVGSVALYQKLGFAQEVTFTQQMLDQSASELDVADFLAYRVQRYDRAEDWYYLANNQLLAQDYEAAVDSFKATLARLDSTSDEVINVRVELAQALFYANNNTVSDEMAQVVEQVLRTQPSNGKALGLHGMIQFEAKHYKDAIRAWQSAIKSGIDRNQRIDLLSGIAVARKQGGITEQMIPSIVTHKLILQLILNPQLLTRDDVFLVYAQRPGTSIPVAIQRISALEIQSPILLTNLDNLMPGETLADLKEVNIVVKRSSNRASDLTQGEIVGQLLAIPSNSEKIFRVNVAL